jgi:hypothetical protein
LGIGARTMSADDVLNTLTRFLDIFVLPQVTDKNLGSSLL